MEDLRKLIIEVLEKGYLMSLATMDEGGLWVCEVVFVHDNDLNIYWLSVPTARHSKAIQDHPNVAGSITLCHGPTTDKVGIQFAGKAQKVEGDILEMAKKDAHKRLKPIPTQEGEIFQRGQSWYRLCPTKIDLVHQPLFGYEKKFLNFKSK